MEAQLLLEGESVHCQDFHVTRTHPSTQNYQYIVSISSTKAANDAYYW